MNPPMSLIADLQGDLRAVIERTILEHPRSQQEAIGPSEIGTPCPRKLGHKLARTPRIRPESPAWRPTVGTAIHTWAEAAFTADNAYLVAAGLPERWLLETSVWVGDIDGEMITGHSDLFDLWTGTSVDWKFPGVTTIKKAKAAKTPGDQYRVQGHLYGRGYATLGLDVKHVAVYMLPAAGELGDGYFWTEPYDEQIAIAALRRADGIAAGLRMLGGDVVLPQLSIAEDYCTHCPWWKPGTTELATSCPGAVIEVLKAPPSNNGPAFGVVA
jgi:hypothetical protein